MVSVLHVNLISRQVGFFLVASTRANLVIRSVLLFILLQLFVL